MAGPIHGNPEGLNAPPPNPATDPRAAGETSPIRTLTGGQPPGNIGQPGQPSPPGAPGAPGEMPAGPDNSGLVKLGQSISDSMLILMQGMPEVAGKLHQAQAMLDNALAEWMQQTMGGGSMGQMGGPPSVAAMPTTSQAGSQYPGGGFGAGRMF